MTLVRRWRATATSTGRLTMAESDRALALNPSLSTPHFYRAGTFYHFGLFDAADVEARRGSANDPGQAIEVDRILGTTAFYGGNSNRRSRI